MPELAVINNCLYCHKPYKANLANHYCDDCVMVCVNCGKLKGLWTFNFDYSTETYKEWKTKGAYGILPAPGHKTTCSACERTRDELEDSPVERLRRAAAKLKPGQLELILNSQKKEEK